ncbi:hypothetical protein F2Q68_00034639 [Brassica cretica]|uniref:ZZ-type domain-containing protein n=1 Tax=Brassica cretica TaxID=69181 RepID=A0A8S9GYE1_BRACR|nr:hypothetical protein F2Q68_00034639 [Brassica cretica]
MYSFRWNLFGFPETERKSKLEKVCTINISSSEKVLCSSKRQRFIGSVSGLCKVFDQSFYLSSSRSAKTTERDQSGSLESEELSGGSRRRQQSDDAVEATHRLRKKGERQEARVSKRETALRAQERKREDGLASDPEGEAWRSCEGSKRSDRNIPVMTFRFHRGNDKLANISCDFSVSVEIAIVLLEEFFPEKYSSRRSVIQKTLANIQSYHKESTSSSDENNNNNNDLSNVHVGIGCDSCGVYPIIGDRYSCKDCKEEVGYDLCKDCYETTSRVSGRFNQQHTSDHRLELDEVNESESEEDSDENEEGPV